MKIFDSNDDVVVSSAPKRLPEAGLDLLFREARTHHTWRPRAVPEALLRELYEVFKFGPTSTNGNPCRIVFVCSQIGKEKLIPAVSAGNLPKLQAAPVTAIIAHDLRFFDKLPRLFPHKDMVGMYANDIAHAEEAAFRNGSMQGAYLIIAARALGLVPTHSIPTALEMARGVAGGTHRAGVLLAPPYAPIIVGGAVT